MKIKSLLFLILAFNVCVTYSQNITFADSEVKSLCVAKWDTNGDGELSENEALQVVSLGSTFRQKANIKSFHELKYFLGLTKIDDYAFYQSGLTEVSIPVSVRAIGDYAFSQSSLGPSFVIPGHVKTIGEYAFSQCYNLLRVKLEEGVDSLGALAFRGPIYYLSLPSSIRYIGHQVVRVTGGTVAEGGNFVLPDETIYVYSRAKEPPAIHANAFVTLFGDGFLVVPFGSKSAYQAGRAWNRFMTIYEFGDVNQDRVINVLDAVAIVDYILGNNPSRFNYYIADVNGDGKISISDAILVVNYILG